MRTLASSCGYVWRWLQAVRLLYGKAENSDETIRATPLEGFIEGYEAGQATR